MEINGHRIGGTCLISTYRPTAENAETAVLYVHR